MKLNLRHIVILPALIVLCVLSASAQAAHPLSPHPAGRNTAGPQGATSACWSRKPALKRLKAARMRSLLRRSAAARQRANLRQCAESRPARLRHLPPGPAHARCRRPVFQLRFSRLRPAEHHRPGKLSQFKASELLSTPAKWMSATPAISLSAPSPLSISMRNPHGPCRFRAIPGQ